jgi:Domain of unknown function (DUF4190)/GYF domain 2
LPRLANERIESDESGPANKTNSLTMQIYVQQSGQQTGPYSLDDVRSRLSAGSLQPNDLAWYEGATGWMPLSSVPGVAGNAPPPSSPVPASHRTSGLAVSSLVLGIASLFTAGLTAIPAVICGHLSYAKIKKSAGKLTGNGLAIAGLVTGYLGLLLIIVVLFLGALAIPAFSAARDRALATQCLSNARQIALACRMYAMDHGGNYPATLNQLVPDYVPDTHLFTCPITKDSTIIGYEYFGGKDSDPPTKILLMSKAKTRDGKRIVIYSDATGDVKRE